MEDILARLIAVGLILLISFPVHEFSHAYAAYQLGDGTAKLFGRLTLNPIAHFDPIGGLLLIVTAIAGFGFGWAKPTPVNPRMIRNGATGEAIVAAAGPLSNLLLAVIGAVIFRIVDPLDIPILRQVVGTFVLINVLLMFFNFVPIPPLDGSKVLYAALDPGTASRVRPFLDQYGFAILIIAILPILPGGQSLIGRLFDVVAIPVVRLLLGL